MSAAELPREQARAIVESILLTAEEPVTPARLGELLEGYKGKDIRDTIAALNELYDTHGHGFTIIEVAGGYQLATRTEMITWVRRFHRDRTQVRLSQAALETLAIVAFTQPLTRIEVDSIRGVTSAGVLQRLMELDLIRIVGRSDGVGRPMLFGTTKEFLILFGLKSLAGLPKPKELEELLAQGERKAQLRNQLSLGLDADGNQLKEPVDASGEDELQPDPGDSAEGEESVSAAPPQGDVESSVDAVGSEPRTRDQRTQAEQDDPPTPPINPEAEIAAGGPTRHDAEDAAAAFPAPDPKPSEADDESC